PLRPGERTGLGEVEVEGAWERPSGSDRPLAQDETEFRELYARRQPLYGEVGDRRARDPHRIALAARGATVAPLSADLPHRPGPAELVADERVLELHPPPIEVRVLT